jgi:hypothetical protein
VTTHPSPALKSTQTRCQLLAACRGTARSTSMATEPTRRTKFQINQLYYCKGAAVRKILGFSVFLATSAALISSSNATCLSVLRTNGSTFWQNNCSVAVNVNWSDNGYCGNWSCSDSIGPGQRSTATIGPQVNWCECQGRGCYAHGPC